MAAIGLRMVLFVDAVGVVGAGTMGSQIAEVFALNGKKVVLVDVDKAAVEAGTNRMRRSLDQLAAFHESKAERAIQDIRKRHGVQLTPEQEETLRNNNRATYDKTRVDAAFDRVTGTTDMQELAEADFVVEAIIEDAAIKAELFKRLATIVGDRAILATNTSALAITPLAEASGRPQRFLGTHFFNPPTTLPLVEIIRADATSDETVDDISNLLATMRNHRYPMMPVPVKECPGFLVNRILGAMFQEAYRCLQEKVASARDIDNAMKAGAGLPMGPLELSDLVGLDVIHHAQMDAQKGLKEYTDYVASPTAVADLVAAGRLGRKSGAGFFDYA